jgi:hypothetical protein
MGLIAGLRMTAPQFLWSRFCLRGFSNEGVPDCAQQSKAMIFRFVERTSCSMKAAQLVSEHGCRVLDVDKFDTTEELIGEILEGLKPPR